MDKIIIENDGIRIDATYRLLTPHIVEVNIISPYRVEIHLSDKGKWNFLDHRQTFSFISSVLINLCSQFKNLERYGSMYRKAVNAYFSKAKAMFEESTPVDFGKVRGAKFRYEIEQQEQLLKEYEAEIRANITEVPAENQVKFLIHPSILKQIFNGKEI